MSALSSALVADLDDQALAELADRLRPFLQIEQSPAPADGWLRGAKEIAAYVGCSVGRIYALSAFTPPRIPVAKDGQALIAKRSELDEWAHNGGGRRVGEWSADKR